MVPICGFSHGCKVKDRSLGSRTIFIGTTINAVEKEMLLLAMVAVGLLSTNVMFHGAIKQDVSCVEQVSRPRTRQFLVQSALGWMVPEYRCEPDQDASVGQ